MKKYRILRGSVNKIDTSGFVDGPGIRTVVFLNGCKLRCKYCQNPETWKMGKYNYTPNQLVKLILKNKNYYLRNNGGVTFSGGDPLVQIDFVTEVCKRLKKYNIHIALDTAGVGFGEYGELLKYVDLVLLDIKHTKGPSYKELTGHGISDSLEFIKQLNQSNVPVWIRQVVVPNLTDDSGYIDSLIKFLDKIKNVKRVDFLPYHKFGDSKYVELGIENPYKNKVAMDKIRCEKLYNKFIEKYKK